MNNSSKPRKGATSRIAGNSATRQTHHIPKGFPGAGKFTSRQALEDYYLPELKARQKAERLEQKRKHDRETRKAQRQRRAKFVANKKDIKDKYPEHVQKIWGETAVSDLREKTAYRWHGAFIVRGGEAAIKRAAELAGSEMRVKVIQGAGVDMRYQIVLTPYFGKYTPGGAEENIPDHLESFKKQLEASGSTVTTLGAFWRP